MLAQDVTQSVVKTNRNAIARPVLRKFKGDLKFFFLDVVDGSVEDYFSQSKYWPIKLPSIFVILALSKSFFFNGLAHFFLVFLLL